jgi:hypothetical protein
MNPKKTIALAVIAIAIIAFYLHDKQTVEKQKKADTESKDLIVVESKDIKKVTVDRGGKKITAERDGENWKILEPIAWPGDKFAWNSIADNLASAKISRTFPDEGETLTDKDRENWGVAKPGMVLTATIKSGTPEQTREPSFSFGHHPPGGDSLVYALSSEKDGKVFILPNTLVSSASKEFRDLRNRKLVDVKFDDTKDANKVTRLEVTNKDLSFTAERGPDNNWHLTQPSPGRADSTQLRKFIDKLGNDASNILDNVAQDKAQSLGLASDQLASATHYKVFTGTEGQSQTFYLGKFSLEEKAYVGKREGTDSLFVLAKEFFNDQPKHVDELRPKKALSLDTWSTDIVSVTSEGKLLYSVEKQEGKWRLVSPESATAERTAVEAVIRAFDDNKIRGFVDGLNDDKGFGLDKPRLVFHAKGKDKEETILFGNESDGKVFSAWKGDPDRFIFDKKLLDALMKDPLSLVTVSEKERLSPKKQGAAAPAPPSPSAPAQAALGSATQAAPVTGGSSREASEPKIPSATN